MVENAVLAYCMKDYEFLKQVIKCGYKFSSENIKIYSVLKRCSEKNDAIDLILASECAKELGISCIADLTKLYDEIVIEENANVYLKNLCIETFKQKSKILMQKINIEEPETIAVEMQKLYTELIIDEDNNTKNMYEVIDNMCRSERIFFSVKTGIDSFDAVGGFREGELILVAARPGMGKTALMTQFIAEALQQKMKIFVSTNEMTNEQLAKRLLSNMTELEASRVQKYTKKTINYLNDDEVKKLKEAHEKIRDSALFTNQSTNIEIETLVKIIKNYHDKHSINCVFIDYIQLLSCSKKREKREQITEISKQLKNFAKEINIPIIALAQLNRNIETDSKKIRRPRQSDLKDSGALEQDADVILFLHASKEDESLVCDRDLIVSKNRNDAANITIRLSFDKRNMKFYGGKHEVK